MPRADSYMKQGELNYQSISDYFSKDKDRVFQSYTTVYTVLRFTVSPSCTPHSPFRTFTSASELVTDNS